MIESALGPLKPVASTRSLGRLLKNWPVNRFPGPVRALLLAQLVPRIAFEVLSSMIQFE
jgi:hypothetical protein